MDYQKTAADQWHKILTRFDCRGWEAIALVFLIGLIASWHPVRPKSGVTPPIAAARAFSARDGDGPDREPAVNLLDCDFDTLSVELSLMAKPRARRQFNDWLLRRGLPRIEVPETLLDKQEAITKAGQRKIGLFVLPLGAESYRFWTDPARRYALPRGEEHISRGALEQPPSTPRYVAWAEGYNAQVTKLRGGPATRSDWQRFADDCDVWQRQFAAYREKWGDDEPGRSLRDWPFAAAAVTARNVLRRWVDYEQVCAIALADRE